MIVFKTIDEYEKCEKYLGVIEWHHQTASSCVHMLRSTMFNEEGLLNGSNEDRILVSLEIH